MERKYHIAGIDLLVEMPEDREYVDEALMPFRVSDVTDPHCYTFRLQAHLTPPNGDCIAAEPGFRVYEEGKETLRYIGSVLDGWDSAYIRAAHQGRHHAIQLLAADFPERITAKTVLDCLAAEHLLAEIGGFVLHCAYVDRQGEAILFTAPSGTGKSTQAALWEQLRGAEVINGDRAAVRMTDAGPMACGLPFAGSSGICKNKTLPLVAIVYLKQAPETTLRRLRGAEAFCRLWEGISINIWDRADVASVSEAVRQVLLSVPVFELACTPDESAILALEGAMPV